MVAPPSTLFTWGWSLESARFSAGALVWAGWVVGGTTFSSQGGTTAGWVAASGAGAEDPVLGVASAARRLYTNAPHAHAPHAHAPHALTENWGWLTPNGA